MTKPGSQRLVNGPEVDAILEARGFERIRPDSMTLDEQVAAFATTQAMVIEGGAAVTNVAFAGRGARFLVLTGDALDHSFFSQIADHAGAAMAHLAGTRVGHHRKAYQAPYRIDPAALRAALDELP